MKHFTTMFFNGDKNLSRKYYEEKKEQRKKMTVLTLKNHYILLQIYPNTYPVAFK